MGFEIHCNNCSSLIDFFTRYVQPLFRGAMASTLLDTVMRATVMLAALVLIWWLFREGLGKNKSPCTFCPISPKSERRYKRHVVCDKPLVNAKTITMSVAVCIKKIFRRPRRENSDAKAKKITY